MRSQEIEAHSHAKPVSTFAEGICSSRVLRAIRDMTAPSFMDLALKAAETAQKDGEVPIGCVIVLNNGVIATAGNRTLTDRDPTAHAESIAISTSHWNPARCARAQFPLRGSGGSITAPPIPRGVRWTRA